MYDSSGGYYDIYWLSSRSFSANSEYAIFSLYRVQWDLIRAYPMYTSNGGGGADWQGIRPVVYLDAETKIEESTSGDGSSVETAWQLK